MAAETEGAKPEHFGAHEEVVKHLAASRNKRLRWLIERTVQFPLVFKAFFWYGKEERAISNHYHRQIVRALQQRGIERAEILVREHAYEGRDLVIQALEEDTG